MKNDLIAVRGVCLANSSFLRETFALHKTPVYLETGVQAIRPDGVTLKDKTGKTFDVPCDTVILSVGYEPKPWPLPPAMSTLWAMRKRWQSAHRDLARLGRVHEAVTVC